MKEDYRYISRKERRRVGRRIRRYRRFKKWLHTEACEELRVVEDCLDEGEFFFPKACTHVHQLPKALVHAVPSEQLKRYLGFDDWWEKNELYIEIQGIIRGNKIPPHIESNINDIKEKSQVRGHTLSEVVHDKLYGCVSEMLLKYTNEPPQWMENAFYTSYCSFLDPDVSTLNIPEIGPIMTAICCMGLSTQMIDFTRWDKQVRESIANELYLNIAMKNEKMYGDINTPMNKQYWEVIRRITKAMLPNLYCNKAKDQKEVEKMLSKQEIKDFISDFDLKPI